MNVLGGHKRGIAAPYIYPMAFDLRLLPLGFYVLLALSITSRSWLGWDFYSDMATTVAYLTAAIHASECLSKLGVLRRDAREGGAALPLGFLYTFVFGFFHWYKIEARQNQADQKAQ